MDWLIDHLSFDIPAFIAAAAAMKLSYQVFVSTTQYRIKVTEVGHSAYSEDASGRHGPELNVRIRNTGLPVHNMRVAVFLVLPMSERSVHSSFFMKLDEENGKVEVFERGMELRLTFAPFRFKSHRGIPPEKTIAPWVISDLRKQGAAIVVHSGASEVARIPLISRWDGILQLWNKVAFIINRRLWKEGTYSDGTSWIDTRDRVPVIGLRASHEIRSFSKFQTQEVNRRLKQHDTNVSTEDT